METLDLTRLTPSVRGWLDEDVGRGDRTTESVVAAGTLGRARIEARDQAMMAGLEVARLCFDILAPGEIKWLPERIDGDRVLPGDIIVRLEGPLHPILTGERTALNLLGRLSAVATTAATYVEAVAGTGTRVVDTRKTTPGLRVLEKYAVRVGGASNHRFGLDDGILIKDNHVAAAGGVSEAVRRARARVQHGLKIEVEVSTLEEVDEALTAGADAVLLDNMVPEMVARAVARVKGKVPLEVSGGVTLESIRAFAAAGPDFISVGALTHSVRTVDMSLEVER